VPRAKVVEYLDAYADAFGLDPTLNRPVQYVEPGGDGRWIVQFEDGTHVEAAHVVMATGFNRVPREPSWPGMETFGGRVRHSAVYRNGADLSGRTVLIVGMGNTGAEIALDVLEHGGRPVISVRGPVNIVPRDVLGRPTAKTALMLGRLPPRVADPIGRMLRRFTVGDLSTWGIETPALPPLAQLREEGRTPVVDVGTVARIKDGSISVVGPVHRFHPDGAELMNGDDLRFDEVILATGYRSAVDQIVAAAGSVLNRHGHPPAPWLEDELDGLYFAGFDGYSTGGVLRGIRLEAPRIADRIRSRMA
jgi:cation diffusion facilitator CzcD-associated flavoprotein CzcO